jgi:formate hydrogenlyase subunit 3/multisubunit Na+/H+ antiporter MnhD subunit
MNFAGPVLLLVGPLLGGLVTGLLGRWQRMAAIAGIILAWLLWAMVTAVPLTPTAVEQSSRLFAGDTFIVFGRSLVLTEEIRAIFQLLLVSLSVLYLLSLLFPQGRHFVPGTLLVLSPLIASLMIEPVAFRALLLLVSMILLAAIIQAEEAGSTRAALRYLIMALLAIPLVLVSSWMLSNTQTALFLSASRLIIIGFAILLAGFPFHIWVMPVIVKVPLLVSAFIFGLVQLVVMAFIFELLSSFPWLQQDEWFRRTLVHSGLVTALIAGLLAATSMRFGRLIGSLVLLDLGISMLTLTMSTVDGWNIAVSLQLARLISLTLMTVGLRPFSPSGQHATGATFVSFRGLGRRYPLSVALFAFGCLSLIGMPMTVGFNARWSVLLTGQTISNPWLPYVVLLAMIGGTVGLWRSLSDLLSPAATEQEFADSKPIWLQGLSVFVLIIGFGLAMFPPVAQSYAARLAQMFG